jgi:hypothetical protein
MEAANPELHEAPPEKRAAYLSILQAAAEEGIPFAVGGSVAMSSYCGTLRPVKDLDVYVVAADKDRMVAILKAQGFEDYFDRVAYDRAWIYRAVLDDLIVDVIWQMANRRAGVDECWLTRGPVVEFENLPIRLLPVEEMIWNRLYVLQRDRCDWPDVFNLLDVASDRIDWLHLKNRLKDDVSLLTALLHVYAWLRPDMAVRILSWMPEADGTPAAGKELTESRVRLLDSRPWLVSTTREDKPVKC